MGNAGIVWKDDRSHRVRVLLITSSFVLRFGVGSILEREQFEVVGETGFDDDVLSLASSLTPDVIVMDVLPLSSENFSTLRALKRYLPGVPILLMGRWDGSEEMQMTLEQALVHGADGYLPTDSLRPLVTSTLLTLFYGGFVLSREAAPRGREDVVREKEPSYQS